MNRVATNLRARRSSSSEEIIMEPDGLQTFIDDVGRVVTSTDDEHEITQRVAKRLSDLLAGGYRLPLEVTRPSPVHHVTYPLYIAPDNSWSMASVVWDVGQRTPVHSHETWGVVGIYSGIEHEVRYLKPVAATAGAALTQAGEDRWEPGQVSVCCTTDDDVHAVAAVGNEPTVGIHVYGGNIGTIRRRKYDPATGEARWFVSGWDSPEGGTPQVRSNG
jgi:predicted metal-dependent enzyme (double-stranded beta helix superfamily)